MFMMENGMRKLMLVHWAVQMLILILQKQILIHLLNGSKRIWN